MEEILHEVLNYCEMINSLTEQQVNYTQYTKEWTDLEHKLVELECKLFNNLLLLEMDATEYLFEEMPVLPMLGIHLHKYFENINYLNEIQLLEERSKMFIELIYEHWEKHKYQNRNKGR